MALGERRSIVKNFREYYQECFKAEKPKFIRVMKAVPADQASYRPHPRSTSAGDLVWLLASELRDAMGAKVPSIYGPSADDPGM